MLAQFAREAGEIVDDLLILLCALQRRIAFGKIVEGSLKRLHLLRLRGRAFCRFRLVQRLFKLAGVRHGGRQR